MTKSTGKEALPKDSRRSIIVTELKQLRRGRGLAIENLEHRLGPALRAASSIADTDPPTVVRRKIILRISELSQQLPEDVRLIALVALGLHDEAPDGLLDQRVSWLAQRRDRAARSIRRRMDEALQLLAEQFDNPDEPNRSISKHAPDGWHVDSIRATLRMDLDPPQLTEDRHIMATVDNLDTIVASLSVPKDSLISPDTPIDAQVIYGGRIAEVHNVTRGYTKFVIQLPQPLGIGDYHEYRIQFTSYPREFMLPYYVLTPLRPSKHLTIHVKFRPTDTPMLIWQLNGVPPRVVSDFEAKNDVLALNRFGEVAVEFNELHQGLSYGIQWQWNEK